MRDAVTTGGNALPRDDEPDVTRFKSAAAKRVQTHRARARFGVRCLTVRVSDRTVRHLISTGYLSWRALRQRRRSRSLLRPGFTIMSPEQAGWRTLCRGGLSRHGQPPNSSQPPLRLATLSSCPRRHGE